MEFPEENYSESPLITPRQSLRRKAEALGLEVKDLRVPRCVILSLTIIAVKPLVNCINAKEVSWIYRARPLYVGKAKDSSVGLIWAAPGAPLATFVMEDLIACGARMFVGVGLCGATQPNIRIGDLIIPTEAIRDEGTSYHYVPKDAEAIPNREVVNALQNACKMLEEKYLIGPVWTTDAPYRETKSKIEFFKAKGVLGVDMETSAIYSLAIYRKVKVGCILVTSDNLAIPIPSAIPSARGLETKETRQAIEKAVRIAMEAINILCAR